MIWGAAEEARLSPCDDNKPQSAEDPRLRRVRVQQLWLTADHYNTAAAFVNTISILTVYLFIADKRIANQFV